MDALIRTADNNPETVVLVGNGAIENGWLPLREVLDPLIHDGHPANKAIIGIKKQNQESFHQLSIISYRFKYYRASILRKLIEGEISLQELEKEGLDPVVDEFLQLRKDIAHSYKKHVKELELRITPSISEFIGESALFITTNWDETLWNRKEVKSVVYLHGRAGLADSIVFPTELLIDDTIFNPEKLPGYHEVSEKFRKLITCVFRFTAIGELMKTTSFASEAIRKAKKIVVWGFDLADYDADINTLLSVNTCHSQKLIIINTEFDAFLRAVGLTGITDASYYNPETDVCLALHSGKGSFHERTIPH